MIIFVKKKQLRNMEVFPFEINEVVSTDFKNGGSVFDDVYEDMDGEQVVPTNKERILHLLKRVEALERRLDRLDEKADVSKRPIISKDNLERMVDATVKAQEHGSSKDWIRNCLEKSYGIEDRKYMRRRINKILKKKIDDGDFKLEKGLYMQA